MSSSPASEESSTNLAATSWLGRPRLSLRVRAWLPVVLCIGAIACESTVFFGADHTTGPLQRFFEFFFGPFTQPQWWRIHIVIRKSGHFLGYGILSAAWFRAFWMTWRAHQPWLRRRFNAHGLAMIGTLAVASSDEFHQLFLPNRGGSAWDVLLDCCGGLVMQSLVFLWMQRRLYA
jgi:VanZ family protein